MMPDEIPSEAPEPFPETATEPPADNQALVPVDPYSEYSNAEQLVLSKLDTLIVGMNELNAYAKATNNGVNWIGTNFQTLLTTVSKLGEVGPMGILKMMKGGA